MTVFEHERPEPPIPGWKWTLYWVGGLVTSAVGLAAIYGLTRLASAVLHLIS